MTPQDFITKWGPGGPAFHLNEEQGAQSHFIDLCDLLGVPNPVSEDDPGDGSLVCRALGSVAKARGMSQLARDTGLARKGLYKALSPDGDPEFATVMKVIKALGLKLGVKHAEKAT